jgi:hypothetical protein
MARTTSAVSRGITVAAVVASTIALVLPAQAVAIVPAWPVAGHLPSGPDCALTTTNASGGTFDMQWVDSSVPVVTDVFVNGGKTMTVPATGATMTVSARVLAPCTGPATVIAILVKNEASFVSPGMDPLTADVFSGLWGTSSVIDANAGGVYRMAAMSVGRRYDGVTVTSDYHLLSAVDTNANSQKYIAGSWALTKLYVLRTARLTNSLSTSRATKGKTVKATTILTMATPGGYAADPGDKVLVQTKIGTGKWLTKATLTTNASGVVSYSFVLTATTQVRFIHNRVLSGKFTNAVASVIKTVTKI